MMLDSQNQSQVLEGTSGVVQPQFSACMCVMKNPVLVPINNFNKITIAAI